MSTKPTAVTGLPERATGGFFRWEFAEEAIAVDLHKNVIDLVSRDVMRARGKMAAGLLLGRVSRGRLLTLTIEHYEPVTPERGVLASPFADRERMDLMLSRWRPGKTRLSLIGLYRSCTPQDAFLTNDDLSALETDFQHRAADVSDLRTEGQKQSAQVSTQPFSDSNDAERIFLLIDPAMGGASSKAVLHITRGGTVVWQSPATEFSRNAVSKQGGTNQSQVSELRPPSFEAEPPRAPEKRDVSAALKEKYKKVSGLTWAVGSLSVAAILIAGIYQFRGRLTSNNLFPSNAAISSDAHLGLKLDQSGVAWKLSWSPDSPAISNAVKGRLMVTDGSLHKDIDLDGSDLRGGTIIYSPITQDVILRLEVDSPDSSKPVSETVRTVGGLLPGLSTPQTPVTQPVPASETASQPPISLPVEPVAKPIVDIRPDVQPPSVNPIAPRKAEPQPSVQPELSKNRLPIVAESKRVETHPIVAAKVQPLPPALKREGQFPVQPEISRNRPAMNVGTALREKEPVAVAKLEPRPAARKPELRTSRPVGIVSEPLPTALPAAVHRGGVVQLAQLISKKNPDYPSSAKEARLEGSVEVNFKIDSNGEVTDASATKGPSLLASAAIEAVQQWRYRPARLDGVPVVTQGSAVIVFKMN